MIEETAPAKVNLALRIVGRHPDGYHLLDSIVTFADIGDRLRLARAHVFSLEITGPFAAALTTDADNLVSRAAAAMVARWPDRFGPVRIHLEKNLPVASGIGGGSADAAATIRAMMRLFSFEPPRDELLALALELGADVPVCLEGQPCRMSGIGERLRPILDIPSLPAVLVNPSVAVSTAEVFSRLGLAPGEETGVAPLSVPPLDRDADATVRWLASIGNDLEAPACAIAPRIGESLTALRALPGVVLARMSGSGATCFALCESMRAASAAADLLRATHPSWWIRETCFESV